MKIKGMKKHLPKSIEKCLKSNKNFNNGGAGSSEDLCVTRENKNPIVKHNI